MRNQIIKTIGKTTRCDISGGGAYLTNPEEVADAVLRVIFGEEITEVMKGKIDMDEVAKRFNKKHREIKMVKAKK